MQAHSITPFSDTAFNKLLPENLQQIAKIHFTPAHIAQLAAEWLTEDGVKKVLDIGAGVGKFCIAGALKSNSFFYGTEHRPNLVKVAEELLHIYNIKNALIECRNITDVNFSDYNAFYLFNPFWENIMFTKRLNDEVPLADSLYHNYVNFTRVQLDVLSKGTRLVTYHGDALEVPDSYKKLRESKDGLLKFWVRS